MFIYFFMFVNNFYFSNLIDTLLSGVIYSKYSVISATYADDGMDASLDARAGCCKPVMCQAVVF